jgi:hypothetical protein
MSEIGVQPHVAVLGAERPPRWISRSRRGLPVLAVPQVCNSTCAVCAIEAQ